MVVLNLAEAEHKLIGKALDIAARSNERLSEDPRCTPKSKKYFAEEAAAYKALLYLYFPQEAEGE